MCLQDLFISRSCSQAIDFGNGFSSENVGYQNTASQIQGDENGIALGADQSFAEVEERKIEIQ